MPNNPMLFVVIYYVHLHLCRCNYVHVCMFRYVTLAMCTVCDKIGVTPYKDDTKLNFTKYGIICISICCVLRYRKSIVATYLRQMFKPK